MGTTGNITVNLPDGQDMDAKNRLVSMLPFRSLSVSTLEGRKGVYALITKDEDRAQPLRLRRPSVRKKLSEARTAEAKPPAPGKHREQER